ncbi:TonB-dependent receptor [Microbulbifer pacificus]|uniref:TonB-dependent receptor n=1 Tax=Microbulbifer pacificus TaxID=407164 RepID=A0AAU0N367_9GAMM|nr:TonB-dependent receptor [Microbulbifer pacificus]WOX06800.1 TonB-dependent receptor [Microbulbifer pacificus]
MQSQKFIKAPLAAVVAILCSAAGVQAQESSAEIKSLEEVVVTGRAGSSALQKAEASYAISTLNSDALAAANPQSTADVLRQVPGFWVESSGGEASNNIRARGIPRDGYSSIALQENGLAIQHDGGLGYLNADQSFRLDETIERVEVVRGGPSAIFASNAPGGVVNFISRKPYDATESIVKVEMGDYGHTRIDGFYGQPVGEDMFFSVGGFYRQNDGVRDPGFTANDGGQVRLSLGKRLEEGELFFDLKHMNDTVAFLLPIPLTTDSNGDVAAVPGFNANYGTMMGPEVEHNVYRNLGNGYDFNLGDGTHTELTQFTFTADHRLGEWDLHNTFRYRVSETLRNGLFPTGSLQSAEERLAEYSAMLGGIADLSIRFANDPSATFDLENNAGNGLVLNGNLLSVDVPLDEMINDVRLTRTFDMGEQQHDVAFGIYYADFEYDFIRYMATAMFEVAEQARLLDVVANIGGQEIAVTEHGILRYGSLYDNVHGTGETTALYASDEWQVNDQLRIDGGLRYEMITLGGSVEGKHVVDLQQSASLADDQFITGNGEFTAIDREYNEFAWTLGMNYQFSDDLGAFARYTDSFRAPSTADFNGSPQRTDLRVEPIKMMEGGIKHTGEKLDVFATAFYTHFDNMRFTDWVFDSINNEYTSKTAYGDTETLGLELEALFRANDMFDFGLAATFQSPEYKTFSFTEASGEVKDYSGNQLIRVPEMSYRGTAGFNLLNDQLRGELVMEHFSDRYADTANTQELPAYTTWSLSMRYDLSEQMALQFNGHNLTNEIGLTEGNPRAGQFESADAGKEFFMARPILGRSYTASIRYNF